MIAKEQFHDIFLGLSYKVYSVLVVYKRPLFYELDINQNKSWKMHFVGTNITNHDA